MKITEEFHLVRLGVKAPFKAVESILQKLGMGAMGDQRRSPLGGGLYIKWTIVLPFFDRLFIH